MNFIHRLRATNVRRRQRDQGLLAAAAGAKRPRALRSISTKPKRKRGRK